MWFERQFFSVVWNIFVIFIANLDGSELFDVNLCFLGIFLSGSVRIVRKSVFFCDFV